VLTACGGERDDSGSASGGRLSIATGNTTGVYFALGGAYARLIAQHVPGYTATAEATGASVENIQRIANDESDIAFTLADTAADAVNGEEAFAEPQPVRALARLYLNYTHVVVRSDAGIATIEDMKGKTVSTGGVNSGTEVIAVRLLEAAGLDPDKDIKRQKLSLPETVQGVKDGLIEALFWSGGTATPGIQDLTTSLKGKVKFLDLSTYLAPLQSTYGQVYQAGTIPADKYQQPADIPSITAPNLLVVKDSMPDDLAFKLVEVLFQYKSDLEQANPAAKGITLENATKTEPVQLHPGAQRYYDEKK
jgi:TRAP transporter TAXI family solute receptor